MKFASYRIKNEIIGLKGQFRRWGFFCHGKGFYYQLPFEIQCQGDHLN